MRLGCATRGPRYDESRDAAIEEAALDLLVELGYDRLTMEAVAARARAGKATLYRRWSSKADLVVDALLAFEERAPCGPDDVDTGSLRADLLALSCGVRGYTDPRRAQLMVGMATALRHDAELARTFQDRFVAPRVARLSRSVERARLRGEVSESVDAELVLSAIPALAVFHSLFVERPLDDDLLTSILDGIVLPALRAGLPAESPASR